MNLDKVYLGTVEDINDPLKIGRCRVRIEFLFGKDIKTEDLPWAYPAYSCTFGAGGFGGSISIPKVGSIVRVRFDNENIYCPIYDSLQELSDDVKSFLQKNYENTHILLYDGDNNVKIYFVSNGGIRIENNGSYINIDKNGTILLENTDGDAMIELKNGTITQNSMSEINSIAVNQIKETSQSIWVNGDSTNIGKHPIYSAVCGEQLMALLYLMAAGIELKNPRSPGIYTSMVNSLKSFILSNTVKVSD